MLEEHCVMSFNNEINIYYKLDSIISQLTQIIQLIVIIKSNIRN